MFQIKFGKFISSLRNEKGLTQDELAEKLHVSSGKIISKWENGNTLPDFEMIMQISKELDISLYELSVCEKIKSKSITKEDILKIVDKKHLKRITLKKKIKSITKIIIGIISLISFIYMITTFNTTQVYKFESINPEFQVDGTFTKTKDYSVFALTDIRYIGNDIKFDNLKVISYDYELVYDNIKIYHNNQFKIMSDTKGTTMYDVIPRINILIDSITHNTHSIKENNDLKLIINYKETNDKIGELEIPIKLITKAKNNKIW